MEEFKETILENKKVSVWGIGYLGYTTILRLQSKGFFANIYDFQSKRLEDLKDEVYPYKLQKESWSKNGEIPLIDISKVNIDENLNFMFDSPVHIISFPIFSDEKDNLLSKLLEIFLNNKEALKGSLILFQSVSTPTTIQKYFIDEIKKYNLNIYISSAFRSDWVIEDFFSNKTTRVIAGYDEESLEKTKILFELFNLKYETLSSIEEAEVYENAKNSLQSTISAFFNQLSFAYPSINIKEMSSILLNNIDLKEIDIGIDAINYKVANSIEHILRGVKNSNMPSIIQETESSNISSILYYADLLKRQNIKSVTILGVSTKGSLRDIRLSSSIILAEYLQKHSIEVYVNDPNFTEDELNSILPFAKYIKIKDINSEAIIVMNETKEYKFLNQKELDEIGITKAKVVIDNIGLFKNFLFSKNSLYHIVGDGNLERLEK